MSWMPGVRHFHPVADPMLRDPDGTKLDTGLMTALDAMRERVGKPFRVTSGYRSQALQDELIQAGKTSARGSAHVTGEAVDGWFVGYGLFETFIEALRSPFSGIGMYPWTQPPVIHVDVRDRGSVRRLWIVTSDNRYLYAPHEHFFALLRQYASDSLSSG